MNLLLLLTLGIIPIALGGKIDRVADVRECVNEWRLEEDGEIYSGCADTHSAQGKPWCATEVNPDNLVYTKWEYCTLKNTDKPENEEEDDDDEQTEKGKDEQDEEPNNETDDDDAVSSVTTDKSDPDSDADVKLDIALSIGGKPVNPGQRKISISINGRSIIDFESKQEGKEEKDESWYSKFFNWFG